MRSLVSMVIVIVVFCIPGKCSVQRKKGLGTDLHSVLD